jgi:hypothetical protein
MRVLLVGWFSVTHGEATAGDVLSLRAVETALAVAEVDTDVAWSAVMRPAGGLALDEAVPQRYSHLVFVCGPVYGEPVRELHQRFARCRRIAIGVSVIDPADPAVTGFHHVLQRDGPGATPSLDLAARSEPGSVPVAGVILTHGQREYGWRRRHDAVTGTITGWLRGQPCTRLPLETRLDPRDWRLCATAPELESIVARLDLVITTRMHGLVLALKAGVPALAVDPIAGGGKVAAQAAAWQWPAILTREELDVTGLDRYRTWCLSDNGRAAAAATARRARGAGEESLRGLVRILSG